MLGSLEIYLHRQAIHKEAENVDEPAPSTSKKPKKEIFTNIEVKWVKRKTSYKTIFIKEKLKTTKIKNLQETLLQLTSPQLFEKILNNEFCKHVTETKRYAMLKIKVFIGISLLSCYHNLLSEKLYSFQEKNVGVELLSVMTKNTYLKIKFVLHFANNDDANTNDLCFSAN